MRTVIMTALLAGFAGAGPAGVMAQAPAAGTGDRIAQSGNLSGNPVPLPGRQPDQGTAAGQGGGGGIAPPAPAPDTGNLSGNPVPLPGRQPDPSRPPAVVPGAPAPDSGNLSGNPVPLPGR